MPVKEPAPWGIFEFGLIMAQGQPVRRNYYGAIYYSSESYAWSWVSNCLLTQR
jgi:hypothetical protein